MTTQQSLLVAVDPPSSVPDLEPVLMIARTTGAVVRLVHAVSAGPRSVDGDPSPVGDQLARPVPAESLDEEGRAALAGLAAVAEDLGAEGIAVEIHVLIGPPVDVVLTAAEMLNASMIVVAGHRHDLGDRTLLGSFTSSLLKVAQRPVLVIPAGVTRGEPGFVAAVDRLIDIIDRDEQAAELAELRSAATEKLKEPESELSSRHLGERLMDTLHRFETSHPTLTKAINDVSYYLSGMGI